MPKFDQKFSYFSEVTSFGLVQDITTQAYWVGEGRAISLMLTLT